MRRIISIALTALMILSMFSVGVFTTTASAADASGSVVESGTVEPGYQPTGTPISTAEEFAKMDPNKDYYLAADITINATYGVAYQDDGTVEYDETGGIVVDTVFNGNFDGNGKTVTLSVPMFADMSGSTVKNLVIKGKIDFRSDTGKNIEWHCGSVAMEGTNLTIENVANKATIRGFETAKTIPVEDPVSLEITYKYDSIYSGGILGSVYGDLVMKDCQNYASVTALVAGGIVGSLKKVPKAEETEDGAYKSLYKTALFENCHNFGTVSDADCHDMQVQEGNELKTKKTGLAAGIISYAVASKMDFNNCTNTADILSTVTKGGVSGGISGRIIRSDSTYNNNDVTYRNCINEGTVIGWSQIGGIGGWTECNVAAYDCINEGAVTSRNNYAGGIVGRPGGGSYPNLVCDVIFERCINRGTVTGHRQYAAGITGYSQDRTTINYCLNAGDIMAEGVTATSDNNSHGHPIISAGMIANTSQTIEMYYCVNVGNIISNAKSAGLVGSAGAGKINNVNFTGGYNTFFGCLSAGDIIVYNEKQQFSTTQDTNGDGFCDDVTYNKCSDDDGGSGGFSVKDDGVCDSCGGEIDVDFHKRYFSDSNAAGILGYSYGSGNNQAPRIVGCGVTANIKVSHFGPACAFMGYANTAFAMIQGNYFIGELDGPEENFCVHQQTQSTDYCLEYATCWIDRCDSEKYIKNNYYYESIATSGAMRIQNNGKEINFDGYDCYITLEDVTSGKLCYLVNDDSYSFLRKYPLVQQLGVDQYPTSPYYYMDDDGNLDFTYWVDEDGNGGYKNVEWVPDTSNTETETEEDVTTEDDDDVTTKADDVTTKEPDAGTQTPDPGTTPPPADEGGCGSVIGASIGLVALALIAPAAIALKKREDEE